MERLGLTPRAYSPLDAAALLSISRSGIYRLIESQQLKSIRIGGRRLVLADSIDALLSEGVTR